MFMWQQRYLAAPPVCTLKHDIDEGICDIFEGARCILEQGTQMDNLYETLGSEIFLVKKVAIKSKSALRNEKALQGLQQLERSLRRLIEINPSTLMKSLLENWPSILNLHHGTDVYLPSRQMLEFALVRTVGCTALLHQICNRAVLTYTAAIGQIEIGMQMKPMLVFAAAASRIWYLCRSLKMQLVDVYSRLLPLLDVLKPTKAIWLRDGFEFPRDLATWLGKETGIQLNKRTTDEISTGDVSLGTLLQTLDPTDEGNREPNAGTVPATNIMADLALEDVGEEVHRDNVSARSRDQLYQDTPETTRRDKKSGSPGAHRKVSLNSDLKQFSQQIWNRKVKDCKSKKELEELVLTFQKEYSIKSKKCKECCQHLKDSPEKGNLNLHRKRVRQCLKRVASIQQKEKRLIILQKDVSDISKDKKGKKPSKIKNNLPVAVRADSLVLGGGSPVKNERSSLNNPSQFLTRLSLKMLRPRGVLETLVEAKEGCITTGDNSWEIPPKALPRVKAVLRKCRQSLKETTKQERHDVIVETVKRLKKVFEVYSESKTRAALDKVGDNSTSKKPALKRKTKEKGKTKNTSQEHTFTKKDKLKGEPGNRVAKQNNGKKKKKNKRQQQTEQLVKWTTQGKTRKHGDNNNNMKKGLRPKKRKKTV